MKNKLLNKLSNYLNMFDVSLKCAHHLFAPNRKPKIRLNESLKNADFIFCLKLYVISMYMTGFATVFE